MSSLPSNSLPHRKVKPHRHHLAPMTPEDLLRREAARYASATVTTALALRRGSDRAVNLFLAAEFHLEHIEQQTFRFLTAAPPKSLPSDDWLFAASEVRLPAADAVRLLVDCGSSSEEVLHPLQAGAQCALEVAGAWTGLDVIAVDDPAAEYLQPFLPHHDGLRRVARLLPRTPPELARTDLKAAVTMLQELTGISLADAEELVGGAVAVFPESAVELLTTVARDADGIGLDVRLVGGRDVVDVTVTGQRAGRGVAAWAGPLGSGLHVIEMDTVCDSFRVRAFDDHRRLVHDEVIQPMRSFSISAEFQTGAVEIRDPDETGRSVTATTGLPMQVEVGGIVSWQQRERAAERARARRELLREGDVAVFAGNAADRETAILLVRSVLSKARKRLWLADPYLDGTDSFEFLPDKLPVALQVRLVTGGETAPDLAGDRRSVDTLVRQLAAPPPKGAGLAIEARRVTGLHDRFVVADDVVWSIGSSFNNLGRKAGVCARLDPGDETLEMLDGLWAAGAKL